MFALHPKDTSPLMLQKRRVVFSNFQLQAGGVQVPNRPHSAQLHETPTLSMAQCIDRQKIQKIY